MVNNNVTNRHESQGNVPLHPGNGLHLCLPCRQMISGAKPESRKTAGNVESQRGADTARWERSCQNRGQLRRLREQSLVSETHVSLNRAPFYEKELILKVFSVFLTRPKLPTDSPAESMLSNTQMSAPH